MPPRRRCHAIRRWLDVFAAALMALLLFSLLMPAPAAALQMLLASGLRLSTYQQRHVAAMLLKDSVTLFFVAATALAIAPRFCLLLPRLSSHAATPLRLMLTPLLLMLLPRRQMR